MRRQSSEPCFLSPNSDFSGFFVQLSVPFLDRTSDVPTCTTSRTSLSGQTQNQFAGTKGRIDAIYIVTFGGIPIFFRCCKEITSRSKKFRLRVRVCVARGVNNRLDLSF
jgi:hypothetical protein